MAFQDLGTVTAINRYPVKSMHAEPLASAELPGPGCWGTGNTPLSAAPIAPAFPG